MMLTLSVVCLAAVLWIAILACRRSGWRSRVCVTEVLRVVLVAIALGLFWQPETTIPVASQQSETIVVLRDDSKSMQTRDVGGDVGFGSRDEAAAQFINDPAWQKLGERFLKIDETLLGETSATSDLASAIDRLGRRYESATAVVVVSDGDWNGMRSPVEAAAEWRLRRGGEVRVFGVPVGGTERMPDVELVSLGVPTFGVAGKPVRIPYTVRNWFPRSRRLTVTLRQQDQVVERREIQVRTAGRFDDAFTWQSDQPGRYGLSVDVTVLDGEVNRQNNRAEKTIEIRSEKLRVLIIEATPRWEFRYLRNALLRDPGIDVSCLLFHPALPGVGGGAKDYLDRFPDGPAELASYDVVFLGDVGISDDQLTLEQCRRIVGLVEQQASGLGLMPGPRGAQQSLEQSELGALFPVVTDVSMPRGRGSSEPGVFSLTDAGRRNLLTQLDDDPQSNWSIWQSLPGFHWHAAVIRAKAGSQVLAVHANDSNQYGRLPLLVSRPAGAGKVLYMGTDSAWRWRMGVEDKYHYRFWGQVIRWMAYQRNMAVGETMRLSFRPESPQLSETISLRASVMTSEGAPSDAASVNVETIAPDGSIESLRMDRADSQWGVFVGETRFDQVGEHRLRLLHPSESSSVEARVAVQGRAVEQRGRPARPDIMREMAAVGGGEVVPADRAEDLVDELNALPPDPSQVRRIQWWNHPLVLLGMVAGMTLFWSARKWAGVI